MQYLKQMPNGNRVTVNKDVYDVDKHHPKYNQIIATIGLTIYSVARAMSGPVPRALRYGGQRPRMGNAWNGG